MEKSKSRKSQMTTSSEDVLLLVNEVRHKKTDGILYLMAERIAWMPNGKDTFTISHKYADIRMQKISPEGKPKIQLQIVLNNNETTTFHFVSGQGSSVQLQMRNEVKELLQQLLPRFKKKISKELEEKNRILSDDPDLYQLYKDLVVSQVITADEFWTQLAPIRCPALTKILNIAPPAINKPNIGFNASCSSQTQSVGISPAFLADIKPQADGCNGIKYNITIDVVEAIFRTYPAVKRKHFENVPHKISESEFWTRFFQSHYFHRDRVLTGSSSHKGDLFADCAKSDDSDIARAVQKGVDDPFVDLTYFDDTDYLCKLDDGGGGGSKKESASETKSKSGKIRDSDSFNNSSLMNANQALIKRFNHHSIMVLEASLSKNRNEKNSIQPTNGSLKSLANFHSKDHNCNNEEDHEVDTSVVKKKRLAEKTDLEELHEDTVMDWSSWTQKGTKPLNITKKECYLQGPLPHIDYDSLTSCGSNKILQALKEQETFINYWKPSSNTSLTPQAAVTALSELSPGGALLKSSHSVVLKDAVPLDLQKELKQMYFSSNELLRHFWVCFPVTSEKLEEKLVQMKSTLERFQYSKLQPLHDRIVKDHYNTELTSHILNQLQTAFNKFTAWQAKRSSLARK